VGLRFIPGSNLDFEVGVRAKLVPSAFAALKWTRPWSDGDVHTYPFVKLYAHPILDSARAAVWLSIGERPVGHAIVHVCGLGTQHRGNRLEPDVHPGLRACGDP